jgi:hypothetical protein
LFAGDVSLEVGKGGWMAFIDGGSGCGTDGDDEVRGEPDEEKQQKERAYIEKRFEILEPDRGMTIPAIKTLFIVFCHFEDEQQQEYRGGEEGEKMGAAAQSEEEGDEAKPAECLVGVGAVVPPQHRPKDDGGNEHGQTVDFALDSGEPGCVAEEIAKCAHSGCDEGLWFVGRGEEENGPEEEHNGESGTECAERVAAQRHLYGRRSKPREGMGKQLVEGGSRGMAYL